MKPQAVNPKVQEDDDELEEWDLWKLESRLGPSLGEWLGEDWRLLEVEEWKELERETMDSHRSETAWILSSSSFSLSFSSLWSVFEWKLYRLKLDSETEGKRSETDDIIWIRVRSDNGEEIGEKKKKKKSWNLKKEKLMLVSNSLQRGFRY